MGDAADSTRYTVVGPDLASRLGVSNGGTLELADERLQDNQPVSFEHFDRKTFMTLRTGWVKMLDYYKIRFWLDTMRQRDMMIP